MRIAWKPLGWGLFAVLVLVAIASLVAARHAWNELLQQNGIETLEWQGLDLSFSDATLRDLTLTQSLPARDVELHGRSVSLDWRWPEFGQGWQPQLTALKAEYLELNWQIKPEEQSTAEPRKPASWPPELPAWLPSEVAVQKFEVTVPCETGSCPLAGSLSITSSLPTAGGTSPTLSTANARFPIKANVQLDHEGHQVGVLATLDGAWDADLNFSSELTIDGTRYLTAESSYSNTNAQGVVSWQGSVSVPDLPQTDWLLAWLQAWQSTPTEHWPEQPEAGSVAASWSLQGPESRKFLAQVSGNVKIQARLPQPWPAPGLGKISGNLEVALTAEQGQWQPETLQADLALSHPAAWINKIPELMRPDSLNLSVRPSNAMAPDGQNPPPAEAGMERAFLPLNIVLRTRGGANVSMNSHLAVTTRAPWAVQLGTTQLNAALPELEVAGWLLTNPKVRVALSGRLDTTAAALKFGAPSVLEVDTLKPLSGAAATAKEMQVKNFHIDLANTELKAGYRWAQGKLDNLSLDGPVGLNAKQVRHPLLLPQSWQFNGKVNSDLARTGVVGLLKAKTGTTVNLDVDALYGGLFTLEGKMRVSGEQEAEALSDIFSIWPPELTVAGGTVSANATYEQPQNGEVRLAGKLVFADWSGTYDRTAWSRLNGLVEFFIKDDLISVTTPELTVAEVNPGLPIGPVLLAGHYKAPLAQLAAGQLTLEQASSGALNGDIKVQPGSWDLSQAPVTIPVELAQLSLARLLQLYPTEGLAGTGILSGTVPVLFNPATGIRVKQGRIDALKPGGRIQLTAERLKALASQSEAMKLVAQALEDFRYSVLDSGIDYDEDGTLLLKLHLEGNSPEVGNGRPVVLNINLEENIPALLTSLQLSGRVSDAVAERVKKLLQKRERDSGDLLE